jgi:hypothetical protein
VPEIAMRKVLAGSVGRNSYVLVPIDQIGDEDFAKISTRKELFVTARSSVNMAKHRLLQATVQIVAEAHPNFRDRDEALDVICYGIKHVRTSYNPKTGQVVISRKSTSPSGFTGEEYDRFFDRVWWYVSAELLPEIPKGDLKREIEERTSNNYDASRRPR